MTKAEVELLVPEKSYVGFAGSKYRVAELSGDFVGIYDEEPHSLHVDYLLWKSLKYIPLK